MNIVVVGGGTAGWLTALYAKKIFPEKNIVLVESEEYGILGAGEGTTPNFAAFLTFLEIPISDLFKNCNATIKNGIKFTNWSDQNKYFFHSFFSNNKASNDFNFNLNNNFIENDTIFSHFCASLQNHNLNNYSFMQKISNKSKVPFIKNKETNELDILGDFGIHFDARLLAEYLKFVGKQRGIVLKEGIVEKIFDDEDGYIYKIKTNKEEINCDFVFDCSGFKRVIIGNHYKSIWKSHSNSLPAKKAIPFFLRIDEKIPPYTESIAMDYGWIWKIPLQDRYGCGYVFDSDFISDEDAIKEIENYLGFEPQYPRKQKGAFNFSAGCFEDIWIKNCLAVGLSAGFIEPLEATSIMQTIITLQNFMSNKQNLIIKNEIIKQQFNKAYLENTNEIVSFLYLHYVTNKTKTKFWKNFIKNNLMPDHTKYILSVSKDKALTKNFDMLKNQIFSLESYYYILIGNNILNLQDIKKIATYLLDDIKIINYNNILKEQDILIPELLTHNNLINIIKTK